MSETGIDLGISRRSLKCLDAILGRDGPGAAGSEAVPDSGGPAGEQGCRPTSCISTIGGVSRFDLLGDDLQSIGGRQVVRQPWGVRSASS